MSSELVEKVYKTSREISLVERIGRILRMSVLELDGNAYMEDNKYKLDDWKSIKNFVNKKLRLNDEGKNIIYMNIDTGDKIILSGDSAGKIAGHYKDGEAYQKTIAHIPQIIKHMLLLDEASPNKANVKYDNYSYYITQVKMEERTYTILSTIGRKWDEVYYDHNVFEGSSEEVFVKAKNDATDFKYSRLNNILESVDICNLKK